MGLARRLSALGLVLSALLVCTRSQDQGSVFALVGENVTFSPKVIGTIQEITWMKVKNKVAEWDKDAKSPTYFSSLLERGELDISSGSLTIKKLNTSDAAVYEAQVLPVNDDQLQYTKFVLDVLVLSDFGSNTIQDHFLEASVRAYLHSHTQPDFFSVTVVPSVGVDHSFAVVLNPYAVDKKQTEAVCHLRNTEPPAPSALNCSVTNGQIRISCEISFRETVLYSWYQDGKKIADANSLLVLELQDNADTSKKVMCIREISKTKINETISLSACFPVSPESLSRGRDGLIAFFVLLLLLFMGALFFLWKKGLLSNILRLIPTNNSAVYKTEEQNHTGDDGYPEVNVQKDYENISECHQEADMEENRNLLDRSITTSGEAEEKNSKDSESKNHSDFVCSQENPDYENTSERNQEADMEQNRNVSGPNMTRSGEEREELKTNSVSQPDLLNNLKKTDLIQQRET